MKSILEICQEVADLAATKRPIDLFDESSVHDSIFLSVAKDTLDSLLRYGDWMETIKEGQLTTTKNRSSYIIADFCPDFYTLTDNTVYIKDSSEKVVGAITPEQWMREKYFDVPSIDIKFKIQNGRIQFLKTPPANVKIVFMYRSSHIVYDPLVGYVEKSVTDKNTDIPIFDEYIVKLGIYWRWLKRNGMDFSVEYNEYERELKKRFADGLATAEINLSGTSDAGELEEVYVKPASQPSSAV